jgi:hypothetical protein
MKYAESDIISGTGLGETTYSRTQVNIKSHSDSPTLELVAEVQPPIVLIITPFYPDQLA